MRLSPAGKRDVRTQFGALPYRVRNGKLQILLITTRRTRRWVIPKGWPQDGATPSDSASTEAFEEAGVEGVASPQCLGIFTYIKEMDGDDLPCVVAVFPLKVKKVLKDWPEKAREAAGGKAPRRPPAWCRNPSSPACWQPSTRRP